jgi:hypothetical protein
MKGEIFIILRLLLLLLLIIIIIYDVEVPLILNTKTNQMIIALFIIFMIIVVDEIIGLLIGIIFLVIYFKHYQKIFNKNGNEEIKKPLLNDYNDSFVGDVKPETNSRIPIIENDYVKFNDINGCIEMPYISNELLEKAQTNIYDVNNYYNEIKIAPDAYGIQGMNADMVHYSGFDRNEIVHNYN